MPPKSKASGKASRKQKNPKPTQSKTEEEKLEEELTKSVKKTRQNSVAGKGGKKAAGRAADATPTREESKLRKVSEI